MVELNSVNTPQYGSINDITQRILLWGKRTGMGLLRVEFSSEFSRQEVLQRLQAELARLKVPFKDIVLPTYQEPAILADTLEQALDECESGVVSISGFATAFSPSVPLAEAMYYLNIRRELLAQRPLRQIWWMTPVFFQTALHAMPDLMSWFSLRLELMESVKVENTFQPISVSTINIYDAKRRSLHLIQRFEQAQQAGGDSEELLRYYLLPALEALAEVGAQKDLRDLTSQFEGYLSKLKTTDDLNLAKSLERLGALYRVQGRYLEAEPILQKALELRQKLFDGLHLDVASSFNHLGLLYLEQGRYSEAESFFQKVLGIHRKLLGEEYTAAAQSMNNLAFLYARQGRYIEAESFHERALKMRQKLFGEEHTTVAQSLNNLAILRKKQGRYIEAELLYQQSLKMRQKLLGEDHISVASSLNNLAILYAKQRRFSESEDLYNKTLGLKRRLLGAEHPSVANSLNGLADLYIAQGRYEEAEQICHQALAQRRHLLGEDNPYVKESLLTLERLNQEKEKARLLESQILA